ncbi:DNA primase [termite gut metagenome]|uniref:DNA primase n=3 Tax=termite gut metagenome TaxID=433724 RepID=A0A5J4R786_9ZZZZ
MNTLNTISIKNYLTEMNIHPVKNYGYYGMYHSPLREEHDASFKVDYTKNLWRDFGTNEGGTLIDLIMRMEHCSFHEAASKLEKKYTGMEVDSFSFHRNNVIPNSIPNSGNESTLFVLKVLPITHPALVDFVRERKIDWEPASLYCKEIHYQIQNRNYFSIGFRNDRGGYELSNPSGFKGCISPKEITTVRNNMDTCLVFEGFWDFLSYFTLQNMKQSKHDVVILNSVSNVSKAMDFIKTHKDIYIYLDNDEGGQRATRLIKETCPSINDRSAQYAGYKDLNDYLCQKKKATPEVKKKSVGLKR